MDTSRGGLALFRGAIPPSRLLSGWREHWSKDKTNTSGDASKRAVAATKDLPWQYENRDKLISPNYHPILQLAYDARSREHAVAWFHSDAARAAIGDAERKQLVATFATRLEQGPARG